MRNLFLLRGAPGSGKSTFIKTLKLEPYTVCADDVRTLYQGPVINEAGQKIITQKNDNKVWNIIMNILEKRMKRGETLIVDATHYRKALLNNYKKLISKYRYRAYIVDFTDIPLEEALKRNNERDEYKRVPEEAIRKMYACFTDDDEANSKFKKITREEFIKMMNAKPCIDYNKYDEVFIIGDIHGCAEPLKNFLIQHNVEDEKSAFIFCGDYIDRGIQNEKVLKILFELKEKKNILLLEGNHEIWLRHYSNNEPELIYSNEFTENTVPQIQNLSKKEISRLCSKLGQMAFFEFRDKKIFVSHGGIPVEPDFFTATEQLIKGTGKYEDLDKLYENWMKNTENTILVHGHRNNDMIPAKVNDRIYNLCSDVEHGENLRVLHINGNQKETPEFSLLEFHNPVFKENTKKRESKKETTPKNIIEELDKSNLIKKKKCENDITSYNFTRSAFYNQQWNKLTTTARGLFIKDKKIVARSYNKFFNIGEMPETELNQVLKMKLPVTAYKKENGFLVIISGAGIFSKSTNKSEHVEIAKETIGKKLNSIIEYAKQTDSSFVFECVNKKDPHIIRYDKNHMYLLDIIKNDFKFEKEDYDRMCETAKKLGLEVKQKVKTIETVDELKNFLAKRNEIFEGFVLEASDGFMVKVKTDYYLFWKKMRYYKQLMEQNRFTCVSYTSEDEVKVIKLMKRLMNLKETPITEIQNIYYNN